jgi:hypothetical protein
MESSKRLIGDIEADETFIGGKARNIHKTQRIRKITGTGRKNKTAMGILEGGDRASGKVSKVRATVIPSTKSSTMR